MTGLGKILVVDDTLQTRLMVMEFLSDQGMMWSWRLPGTGPTNLGKDADIDLVLLDVIMPEMDGFETLQYIRGDPKTKLIKVIMLTGSYDTEDITRPLKWERKIT